LKLPVLLWALLCLASNLSFSQDSAKAALPANYLDQVSSRLSSVQSKLDKESEKTLKDLEETEQRLRKKLARLDPQRAKETFSNLEERYSSVKQKLEHPEGFTTYIPYFDTLKTSLKFLTQNKELLSKTTFPTGKLQGALSKVDRLESSLTGAETVKNFIQERKAYLKEQLKGLPFTKEFRKLNKQAYYYSAQLAEYKELIKDKKKMERKAIELLSKTKVFQDFMRKNSQLAALFGSLDLEATGASLAGLQTRAQVNNLLQGRIATGGTDAQSMVQQNLQAAQTQLSQLKDKVEKLGNTGSTVDMPDFKPNNQKTKSFSKRLEYSSNLQTVKGNRFFPITSDFGLSIGYKLNDKSSLGIGTAYKMGWGTGWNNIRVTHQGVGLRSYVDYKLKGSLYISGGYEQNYLSTFQNISQLKEYSAWQTSGLIGLSKKYKISPKLKGNMQLLWDFLSQQQIPHTQPILFRIGYGL
jgi:hypothetical protein